MNDNIKKANRVRIEHIIKHLEKRNMSGYYCETSQDAAALILRLIPEGSNVAWGGSATLDEIGIKEILKSGNYDVNDPMSVKDPAEGLEARKKALLSDVFLTSTNAVTMDGQLVNIDGRGNRVAAMIFGPDKVVVVAGVNKIVRSEADAVSRIKCDACPPNCTRLGMKTPCALTGVCADCLIKGQTVCCHTVTTRASMIDGRIHVILVNEILGF